MYHQPTQDFSFTFNVVVMANTDDVTIMCFTRGTFLFRNVQDSVLKTFILGVLITSYLYILCLYKQLMFASGQEATID